MPRSNVNSGFVYVTNYSYKFLKLIQSMAERAEKVLPSKKLNNMGVFLFGSPSRQEMIDESDADIMIVRKEDNEDYTLFRSEFISLLEKEKFPKIDIPEWGSFEDCESYLKHSVTEGNQVVEAKFVYGDNSINDFMEMLRDKYCTSERFEKVFCFQKFYFDQYYTQRTKPGIKNVKYGHGGTRDFMFLTWFTNILDLLEGRKINIEDNFPMVHKSLGSFYERRLINFEDYKKYLKSINIVLILRNEILIQNKWTNEEGLTYLDNPTLKTLFKRKVFVEDSLLDEENLKSYLDEHIKNVIELKQRIWDLFVAHLYKTRGCAWADIFKELTTGRISNLEKIDYTDELLQMAVIWNIKMDDPNLFKQIFDKYSKSQSWTVLASLCCHPQCPNEVLDNIATDVGCKKGYEYLLRIISRNKNVSRETLRKIIDNPILENRYKIVAKTAYDGGIDKANELR